MSSNEPINSVREGSIDINGEYLNYAVLQDDQFVIVQSSLYFYLEINTKDEEIIFFPTEKDNLIYYTSKSGEPEIGIPIADLAGYCLSVCQLFVERKIEIFKKTVRLLKFLTTLGLSQLINEENSKPVIEEEKPEPSFDDLIEGLLRVRPPQKKKK